MRVFTAFLYSFSLPKNILGLVALLVFAVPASAKTFRQTLLEMSVTNILVLAAYTVAVIVVVYYLFRVRYINKKKKEAE